MWTRSPRRRGNSDRHPWVLPQHCVSSTTDIHINHSSCWHHTNFAAYLASQVARRRDYHFQVHSDTSKIQLQKYKLFGNRVLILWKLNMGMSVPENSCVSNGSSLTRNNIFVLHQMIETDLLCMRWEFRWFPLWKVINHLYMDTGTLFLTL